MEYRLCFLLCSLFAINSWATNKDSTIYYTLPDTVTAVSFISSVQVQTVTSKKEVNAGIRNGMISLALQAEKNSRQLVFRFPSGSAVMAQGMDVKKSKSELSWQYNWVENEKYKLLLSIAADSAGNFVLYSGYVFLPKEAKWKLIGTCKITGEWNPIKQPAAYFTEKDLSAAFSETWCQRSNGSWKNLAATENIFPVINLLSHIDSTRQLLLEKEWINQAIAAGKTDAKQSVDDVYYTILTPGTGRKVTVNDTVTVHYQLNLFQDGSLVEQSKEKPSVFPLKRLIKGWQIGIPLCNVGGKIKLVIPSSLAYSVRTRASKIPPNSILVFEIEVLDAKAPQ